MLADHSKETQANLLGQANSVGQAEAWPAVEAEMKSPRADYPAGLGMTFAVVNDRVVDDREINESGADTPGTSNPRILKLNLFFRNVVT